MLSLWQMVSSGAAFLKTLTQRGAMHAKTVKACAI